MTDNSQSLPERLARVRERIHAAEQHYGRESGSVQLLAVSKTRPAEDIRACHALGQQAFGENYLQEAREKQQALATLGLEWHFIGPLQSNKSRPVAEHFDWVHSVDRLKLARRLSEQRPEGMAPLNLCLQVNVSGETSKSGCGLDELSELAAQVAALPGLRLRGLMAIPARGDDLQAQRAPFARLREALEALNTEGLELDTLSMGMSGDLEAAIAEGATIVRIGTDIFGPRHYPPKG